MEKVLHAIDMRKVLMISLIGVLLGCLLSFVNIGSLVAIIIVIIGILMIVVNGYRLYIDMSSKKQTSNDTLLYTIGILLGFILMCFSNIVITILVAIYLIGEPLVRIICSKRNKEVLFDNLPKILLGVILLVSGISTFDIVFRISGVIVLVVSLMYLGVNYYFYRKSGVKIIK